ncbi:MAG: hypothetical protein AAB706_01065 [Patescibacteria group bacterium]
MKILILFFCAWFVIFCVWCVLGFAHGTIRWFLFGKRGRLSFIRVNARENMIEWYASEIDCSKIPSWLKVCGRHESVQKVIPSFFMQSTLLGLLYVVSCIFTLVFYRKEKVFSPYFQ